MRRRSLGCLVGFHLDLVLRQHRELSGDKGYLALLELFLEGSKKLRLRVDLVGLLLDRDILGLDLQGELHELLFAHLVLSTANSPFLSNIQATQPFSPRLPPLLEKR